MANIKPHEEPCVIIETTKPHKSRTNSGENCKTSQEMDEDCESTNLQQPPLTSPGSIVSHL